MKKVLFVNSEMFPYLPETDIARVGRELPQAIQEKGREIRVFMPRYGCINERKNQLHEVIRLSGINIIVGDTDHPLMIKVASLSAARLQVYFIDNDDYFKRKSVYTDENGKLFEDNGERAIFFARGVLETVKKLRWAPDIIHCQGWMSQVVPLYLKKAYKDDPIFSQSKIVLSLYGDTPDQKFGPGFAEMVPFGPIKAKDVPLTPEATGEDLAKMAALYSDGIIMGSADVAPSLASYCASLDVPVLECKPEALADGSYTVEYNGFYDLLL